MMLDDHWLALAAASGIGVVTYFYGLEDNSFLMFTRRRTCVNHDTFENNT